MVERIREILKVRQLTPTQFADMIGIARPIVSHILSGRNKPSLEVVQKIIAAFPDLSLPWLLSGSGTMAATPPVAPPAAPTRSTSTEASIDPEAAEPMKRARVATPRPANEAGPATYDAAPITAAAESQPAAPGISPVVAPAVVPASLKPDAMTPAAEATALSMAAALGEPGKAIRRIVIFYHDGTFAAYQPE